MPVQLELMAAGQQELAGPPGFIHPDLEIGQQFRHMLNLVQDGPVRKAPEETARIVPREGALVRRLQVDVGFVRKAVPAQGGLSALARPGHGDDRVLREQGGEGRGECAAAQCQEWLHGATT